jgi:hypothetical protein
VRSAGDAAVERSVGGQIFEDRAITIEHRCSCATNTLASTRSHSTARFAVGSLRGVASRRRDPTGSGAEARARSKVGAETTAQLVWILATRLPDPRPDTSDASDPVQA